MCLHVGEDCADCPNMPSICVIVPDDESLYEYVTVRFPDDESLYELCGSAIPPFKTLIFQGSQNSKKTDSLLKYSPACEKWSYI